VKKNAPDRIRDVKAFEMIRSTFAPFSLIICVVVSVKPKFASVPAIARYVSAMPNSP